MNSKQLNKNLIDNNLSRRRFLQMAGLIGAGLVAQACGSSQPAAAPTEAAATTEAAKATAPTTIAATKSGLANGMIGGPT
ncbi:MAG: twin-arginine translocation signal domain-containing protein, partial [Chloroflexi bacterium]|nr:twin-arginine translocation signal domain-containing protein [Chloroflexota bacterium]